VVVWIYGFTGNGKSSVIPEFESETMYSKNPENLWWDGYDGEPAVVINDFRAKKSGVGSFAALLNLFDFTPYRVENKGGSVQFRAQRIWITTAHDPISTMSAMAEENGEDVRQILRRIDHVVEFDYRRPNTVGCLPGFDREKSYRFPVEKTEAGEPVCCKWCQFNVIEECRAGCSVRGLAERIGYRLREDSSGVALAAGFALHR